MKSNFVYSYVNVRQITVDNGIFSVKENSPMSLTPIIVHKGMDNPVVFRSVTTDRIPYDIPFSEKIYGRLIDTNNHTVLLEKLCTTGPAKGVITLLLDGSDLSKIYPGKYRLVLIRTEELVAGVSNYLIEKPLHSDMAGNLMYDIEITEQSNLHPLPSIEILPINWIEDILIAVEGINIPVKYTSSIPGARILNKVDAVHSFSTYTENFTGVLELWGTLEDAPSPYVNEIRWFKIYPSSMSQDIQYIGYTGTQAWTFQANVMYIKFRLLPSTSVLDAGKMNKIIVRM